MGRPVMPVEPLCDIIMRFGLYARGRGRMQMGRFVAPAVGALE